MPASILDRYLSWMSHHSSPMQPIPKRAHRAQSASDGLGHIVLTGPLSSTHAQAPAGPKNIAQCFSAGFPGAKRPSPSRGDTPTASPAGRPKPNNQPTGQTTKQTHQPPTNSNQTTYTARRHRRHRSMAQQTQRANVPNPRLQRDILGHFKAGNNRTASRQHQITKRTQTKKLLLTELCAPPEGVRANPERLGARRGRGWRPPSESGFRPVRNLPRRRTDSPD